MTNSGEASPGLATVRILIVDDDKSVRRAISRALGTQGYQVLEADSTEAALDLLTHVGPVPLVVTDIHMPRLDGLALLRELRQVYPDTAVIMLTGDGEVTTAVGCLKMGAVDYLSKPIEVEEMRGRVASALRQQEVSLELRRLREAYQRDLELQVGELSRKNQSMYLAQVQMAVTMLEAKDPYTRGHSARVAQYAVATARRMGLDPALIDQIRLGGELHDIGKIGTRDAVLNKPGPLTTDEFAEVRRHTTDGEIMLEVLRADHPDVLAIVRSHHERMDGGGFPDGLVANAIPLSARIVCVVDAFDAMTSTRTYRDSHQLEDAISELERQGGSQFDPAIVAVFVHCLRDDLSPAP